MRARQAGDEGLVIGRREGKILPASKQPDMKALFCKKWRATKKQDPMWMQKERVRVSAYTSSSKRKKSGRTAQARALHRRMQAIEAAVRQLGWVSPFERLLKEQRKREQAALPGTRKKRVYLRPETRMLIAQRAHNGESMRALSIEFGTHYATIQLIRRTFPKVTPQ